MVKSKMRISFKQISSDAFDGWSITEKRKREISGYLYRLSASSFIPAQRDENANVPSQRGASSDQHYEPKYVREAALDDLQSSESALCMQSE